MKKLFLIAILIVISYFIVSYYINLYEEKIKLINQLERNLYEFMQNSNGFVDSMADTYRYNGCLDGIKYMCLKLNNTGRSIACYDELSVNCHTAIYGE